VFLANPDRYGRFGHQTLRLLVPILLAQLYRGYFILPHYEYMSHDANDKINLSLLPGFLNYIPSGAEIRRMADNCSDGINTKYEAYSSKGLYSLLSSINDLLEYSYSEFTIISLPFDQEPGKLLNLFNRINSRDWKAAFGLNNKIKSESLHISVHIRRGDVMPHNHPDWYIDDRSYIRLTEVITEALAFEGVDSAQISLIGQGLSNELIMGINTVLRNAPLNARVIAHNESSSFLNNNYYNSFVEMASSDVVVGGLSSFSYLAHLVGGNNFISFVNPGKYPHEWPVSKAAVLSIYETQLLQERLIYCIRNSLGDS